MKFLLSFCIGLFLVVNGQASGKSIKEYSASYRGKILFLRHALAPGFGDPNHFQIGKCGTQRNINEVGRKQAIRLGQTLRNFQLKFNKVYSSEWCRCIETAKLLDIGEIIPFRGLNSFYQEIVPKMQTLELLKMLIKSFEINDLPIVMVTHFVTINSITGISVQSGGAVAFDPFTGEAVEVEIQN